jgi:hypothetical protein
VRGLVAQGFFLFAEAASKRAERFCWLQKGFSYLHGSSVNLKNGFEGCRDALLICKRRSANKQKDFAGC